MEAKIQVRLQLIDVKTRQKHHFDTQTQQFAENSTEITFSCGEHGASGECFTLALTAISIKYNSIAAAVVLNAAAGCVRVSGVDCVEWELVLLHERQNVDTPSVMPGTVAHSLERATFFINYF